MQQLPYTTHKECRQWENSFATKYLPSHLISVAESQNSLLCTPENYMLILSYSSSLEKENQVLRRELAETKDMLKMEQIKCKQLQLLQEQIKMQSHQWQHSRSQRVSTEKNSRSQISFQKIKKGNPLISRQQKLDQDCNNCGMAYESLLKDIDGEITSILLKQNQELNEKIQRLLKQKQITLEMHERDITQRKKLWKLSDKFGVIERQPFENISLISNLPREDIREPIKFAQKQNSDNYGKPDYQFYRSEPNSLDISFQAPPSFKSAQDLPRFFRENL